MFFVKIFGPFVLISMILYFVINKPEIKTGKFFYGLLFGAVGLSLGGLLYDGDITHFLTVGALSFLIVFLYVFFNSTTDAENFKSILIKSAVGVIFVVLAQILIYYVKTEDFIGEIVNKSINLGWGNSNNAAFILCVLLPVTFLLSIKYKFGFIFVFLAYLQIIGIIFTLSRGNFLIAALIFAALAVVSFIKSKNKWLYAGSIAILAIITIALIFGNIESINVIKDEFFQNGFDDNGRFELFQKAIEDFKLSPLFGVGFYKDFKFEDNLPLFYHNTPLQILASLGVFGSLCFVLFFIQRYMLPLKNFNLSNFYIFSVILITAGYGLIECNFTMIYNAFIVIGSYLIIEREKDTVNVFRRLFKRGNI
jgi:O-antigen ligase